jgi:hypothetical protein
MNVPVETLIGWVGTGVAIVGHYFVFNYRLDQLEKKTDLHDNSDQEQFKGVWKWKNEHEREAQKNRDELRMGISRLEGANMVVNEQFKQIMNILTEIKNRLTQLENGKNP